MRLNTVECSLGIDNYDDTILIIMVLGGAVAGTHYRLNIRAGAPLHTTQDIMQRAVLGVMRARASNDHSRRLCEVLQSQRRSLIGPPPN